MKKGVHYVCGEIFDRPQSYSVNAALIDKNTRIKRLRSALAGLDGSVSPIILC